MPEREELLAACVAEMRPILHALYETAFARGMRRAAPRCVTCMHWTREDSRRGRCFILSHDAEYGANRAIQVSVAYGASVNWIYTRSDFGCVMHAARENEDADERDSG